MKFFFVSICFCSVLFAQVEKNYSPQLIQKELDEAQSQFRRAKKMFNPWYTGPLVTPPADMTPPGVGNIQPYLFGGGAYAQYTKNRTSKPLANNLYSLELLSTLLTGITQSVDFNLTVSAIANWQGGNFGGGFNDVTAIIGFLITPESLYVPAMKFTVGETFPTGKYQHLRTQTAALNATGQGAFQTQFGFIISKVIWWLYSHPLNLRGFFGYTVPDKIEVEGVNAYGGGSTTKGFVHLGRTLTADLGIELSFTEKWVGALDVVYQAQGRTKFWGYTEVPVGTGYNDNLSLAPAIEYNWNENLGVISGVQFSVYGRNSLNFAKGQFSVTYTW